MRRRDALKWGARTTTLCGLAAASPIVLTRPAAAREALVLDDRGAVANLTYAVEPDETTRALVRRWILKSAEAVTTYYGRFPVSEVAISVEMNAGRRRAGGKAFPDDPPQLQLSVPPGADEKALLIDDWVLVHEMVHLAFPYLGRRHLWMAEGLAVYVEPVARIMAGHMTAERMWADFVDMMPRGLPAEGDGGYDETGGWARTYWGGAIFCLVCDIRLRQATDNEKGLRDALIAVNREMNFSRRAALGEPLAIGDAATGTTVLTDAWKEMRANPYDPDLDRLWTELGVSLTAHEARFDDTAPLAAIRQAITRA
ncbi:MAG: hypothetical protein KDJ80_10310 [Nitratireductor sp.]|nr:hypothetical protein [Nitratireductor sp.]